MARSLQEVQRRVASTREGRDGSLVATIHNRVRLISNAAALKKATSEGSNGSGASNGGIGLLLLRDVFIYLIARFLFVKSK